MTKRWSAKTKALRKAFARMSPEQKARYVQECRAAGKELDEKGKLRLAERVVLDDLRR